MAKDRIDRDEEDLVRLYLTDIGQYALLTKDDEIRLAQEIEGGIEARKTLDKTKNGNVAAAWAYGSSFNLANSDDIIELHMGAVVVDKLVRDAMVWTHLAGDTVQRIKILKRIK